MSKLWYPVALTVTMAGCDTPADSGYVPPTSGGSTHVSSIATTQTGGRSSAGGASAAGGATHTTGGTTASSSATQATGGSTNIDTGTPEATGGRPPVVYGAIGVYGLGRLF
jgi:hypothetical protein